MPSVTMVKANQLVITPNRSVKEMAPVVIATRVWGAKFPACLLQINSDNMAVVWAINLGTAKDPLLIHTVYCLLCS